MQSIRENSHPRGLARLLGLLALIGAATLASPAWSQATPPRGGTLTWIIPQEPAAFVPLTTSAGGSAELGPKVIEGLLAYDRELKPIAQLATGWQVSADGLRYEFTLRQGVKWHDGQPFTAADAAYSIATIKAVHPRGRVTFANVGAIETPDDHTLVLKLEKPAPYLLTALSASESPIVPKHLYEGKDVATNPRNNSPVGTGPFIFGMGAWQPCAAGAQSELLERAQALPGCRGRPIHSGGRRARRRWSPAKRSWRTSPSRCRTSTASRS